MLRYLLTTPFLVGFWMVVLMTLLAAAARDRSGTQIMVATCAVVGGSRLLAHIKEEIAHELAKAVPIAILGYVIIGGGLTGIDPFVTFEAIRADRHVLDLVWTRPTASGSPCCNWDGRRRHDPAAARWFGRGASYG